jgi:hypothetical protein
MGITEILFLLIIAAIIYKSSKKITRYLLFTLLSIDVLCRIIIFVLNFEFSKPFFIFLFLVFQIVLTLSLIKKFNFVGISTRVINLSILSIALMVIVLNLYFTIVGSHLSNHFFYNKNYFGNLLFHYVIPSDSFFIFLSNWRFLFFDIFTTILAAMFFYFEEFKPSLKLEEPQKVGELYTVEVAEKPKQEPSISIEYYVVIENEQRGPLTMEDIKPLISMGIITKSTLMWKEGMADWVSASELETINTFLK